MSTPAAEQYDFSGVAAQAASNALYSHGVELERRQFKTVWSQRGELEAGCVFSLVRTDEHHAGDYYRIGVSESDYYVVVEVSFKHMSHLAETPVTRQDDHWHSQSEISITGNADVDKELIQAKLIDIIDAWVL